MVLGGAGAEVLRNRGSRGTPCQQRAIAHALGYTDCTEGDFVPAKNKQFPYYSPARDANYFNRGPPRPSGRASMRYHRRNDVQKVVDRTGGVKRVLEIERPPDKAEAREVARWQQRRQARTAEEANGQAAVRRRKSRKANSVASSSAGSDSCCASSSSTATSNGSSSSSANSDRSSTELSEKAPALWMYYLAINPLLRTHLIDPRLRSV